MLKLDLINNRLKEIYESNWFNSLNPYVQKVFKEELEYIWDARKSNEYYNELEHLKKILTKRNNLIRKLRKNNLINTTMIISTCDNCKETYDYELPICPWCMNESFDIEETSSCCGASRIWETDLCSDCKEYWF